MPGLFDFAPNSHVAVEIPPEEQSGVSFNGWSFAARPSTPYAAKFKLSLSGMRWVLAGAQLDISTDAPINAGRLLMFYRENRKYGKFFYDHEFLGTLECRFAEPVQIPAALPNSNGLIDTFEVNRGHIQAMSFTGFSRDLQTREGAFRGS